MSREAAPGPAEPEEGPPRDARSARPGEEPPCSRRSFASAAKQER